MNETKRKASDYSDYQFNLGFTASRKTLLEPVAETEDTNQKNTIPILPASQPDSNEDILYTLRHFHLGDPSTLKKTEQVGEEYVPALLHAYRDASNLRYDYPLFLYSVESPEAVAEQLAKPLSTYLRESVESFAPGADNARILKDNLPRIERELRQTLRAFEGPVETITLLSEAGETLQEDLGLDEENQARLQTDFNKLLDATQKNSQILGYGRFAAIHLLNHAIRCRLLPRRTRFQEKIQLYIQALKKLLNIDWNKSDDAIEPKMALDSVGTAGARFDPILLSDIMDHSRGSLTLSAERHQRILDALRILEDYLQENDPILVKLVHLGHLNGNWLDDNPTIESVKHSEPCAKATALFDEQTAKWATVFGAARIAQLEIDDIYDNQIHDPWFTHFSWEAFSKAEILLMPVVIAFEAADQIAGRASSMRALSRLLTSGRPVQVLTRVQAHNNPLSSDEEAFINYRFEMGYFGLSHRQAVISQSSPARHRHLLKQFLSGLDATRTSLHIINTGLIQHSAHGINAWLIAGAALESRTHPYFQINPEAGEAFADRMDFSGNPQPESDWAYHPFQYQDDKGNTITTDLAFTFADYALLIPRLRQHFRIVPAGFDNEAFVQVDVYLSNCSGEKDCKRIPFIWAVNDKGEVHKLVISRALLFACYDRLNYWHTLQELAGIHNKYVVQAEQKALKAYEAEAQAERERLQAEQAEAVEQVRQDTAGEVMQRLTDVLLGMDFSTASPSIRRAAPAAKTSTPEAPTVTEAKPEPEEEEEEEVTFDEPWIDNTLCTTCNDCMKVNSMLFIYNDNKQAILGDINSGTYAHFVEAAELCPAHCIYPGKPRNPNEPGLEDLIKRAEPLNKL
ncbi:MAG: ferredoxin [Candidatus Parabeggiatoa sp. nov. 3]|nr:MAG: ferredoxin [Gammaproteobacteria bacterium]RKZ68786.1 MAG: ferredoxin [Gammaproteobacteria bacterium]RKZ83956.1 MAG: ferredoxin [Gammaproteobacteria bacterium]HEW98221.1 ferredoxin [Beggiatoa sp.]